MNATLMSRIRILQDFSHAARLSKYIMKRWQETQSEGCVSAWGRWRESESEGCVSALERWREIGSEGCVSELRGCRPNSREGCWC